MAEHRLVGGSKFAPKVWHCYLKHVGNRQQHVRESKGRNMVEYIRHHVINHDETNHGDAKQALEPVGCCGKGIYTIEKSVGQMCRV